MVNFYFRLKKRPLSTLPYGVCGGTGKWECSAKCSGKSFPFLPLYHSNRTLGLWEIASKLDVWTPTITRDHMKHARSFFFTSRRSMACVFIPNTAVGLLSEVSSCSQIFRSPSCNSLPLWTVWAQRRRELNCWSSSISTGRTAATGT